MKNFLPLYEYDKAQGCIAYEIRAFAQMISLVMSTTTFNSPESNRMVTSLIKTFKRDYVHMNKLPDDVSVMKQLQKWLETIMKTMRIRA